MKQLLWLLLFLPLVVEAAPINLSSGELYNFSYTNVSNETSVQGFYCSANATTCNITPYITSMNVSLLSGESRSLTNGFCSVNASCQAISSSVNTCSINRELDSGEEYSNTDGACNVHFECQEPEDASSCIHSNTTVTHTETVKISGDQGAVKFEFAGQVQEFKRNATAFNYESTVDYVCPVEVKVDALSTDEMLTLCQDLTPYLVSWADMSFKKQIQYQEDYTSCMNREAQSKASCDEQVLAVKDQLLLSQNDAENTRVSFNNCLDERGSLESRQFFFTGIMLILGIVVGVETLVVIILTVVIIKNRSKNRGEE